MRLDNKLYDENLTAAVNFLQQKVTDWKDYQVLMVLGSGYNHLADSFKINHSIKYADIPFWPICTAPYHFGNLVFAEHNGKKVVFMQGRHHYCEGYSMSEIAFPIYTLSLLNVQIMIASNAAASLNAQAIKIGEICAITDHINAFGDNPIIGLNNPRLGIRWPIPQNLYDDKLRQLLLTVAEKNDIKLRTGVYVGYPGGIFETASEARMYKPYAQMIGMSIVPEAIAAFHSGMKVAGLTTATVCSIGDNPDFVDDDYIMKQTQKMAVDLKVLLVELLAVI
ncbi:purine-nucleoside phosphorylase [Spiroplasma sp. SV19]|uniref:purine-nucleoside phosphorylase n=1 Tax=Spiroplasma sp. SV19 TaxID=2570468 RepID=UPI0024B759EE|nr:purine-nucleoside phosphorylase [Spiroplasma sp. SV19]WHQ37330.1 purine-nucleoside phosphorylase [Spiroplasma sp. SV19]